MNAIATATPPPPHQQPTIQVRVGVRVRPLTSSEQSQDGKSVVQCCPVNRTVGIAKRKFTYDSVFDSGITQSDLYETVARPMLGSFLDGYNATIMAYGQTGSGKTFTMGSEAHSVIEESSGGDGSSSGLIPRFMSDIFASLERRKTEDAAKSSGSEEGDDIPHLISFKLSASFLEVYGEDVHDLLDEDRKALPLREDSNGGVVVVGLKNRPVQSAEDALNVLHVGTLHRTTAATLMNHQSSRSHAVFAVELQQTTKDNGGVEVTTSSQFTFVDLAGSERMKKTGAEGERAREGIKINEGLLALGNVINALADDERLAKGGRVHVPYRQSKLTRLLQDALGGNSQTLFLACVSPSDTNASETLSTLHYANRARNIKNAPTKNVDGTLLEMQRLNALNHILQCELVKNRFLLPEKKRLVKETVGSEKPDHDQIGHADEELLKRRDVQEYMDKIYQIADEKRGSGLPSKNLFTAELHGARKLTEVESDVSMATSSSNAAPITRPGTATTSKKRIYVNRTADMTANLNRTELDVSIMEVNPDEDMAILDQLLELQSQDHEFDKAEKEDQAQLEKVEGELEEQEGLLLQLKESLKVYHNLKAKYEVLMGEVQSLEAEKASLAAELDKAQIDPTKGCSVAIKKKMEKVEASLARARSETRKHQQMYRKAEQEAQKCKTLENRVKELKQGRVNLIKKQREASTKHKEFTEAKTREIQALKRKERKAGKQVSKLEAECRKYKGNLERQKQYALKLKEKQKQTESHLMSLLALKKRKRQTAPATRRRQAPPVNESSNEGKAAGTEAFAPMSGEISSMKFLLEKMVSDRVANSRLRDQYGRRVADYSDHMRELAAEVKKLQKVRKDGASGEDEDDKNELIRDQEQIIEDLELRLDLVGAELEDLRSRLPSGDDDEQIGEEDSCSAQSKSESASTKMISNMNASTARTMLWNMLELLTKSELERIVLEETVQRKDSALQSFENEVAALTKQQKALSSELDQKRRASAACGSDPVEAIRTLDNQLQSLKDDLSHATKEREATQTAMKDLQDKMHRKEIDASVLKEKLSLAEVFKKKIEGAPEAEAMLNKMQALWGDLGVPMEYREEAKQLIENCLENVCNQNLEAAITLRQKTRCDVERVRAVLMGIYRALGRDDLLPALEESNFQNSPLLKQLEVLKDHTRRIEPSHTSAIDRRSKLISELERLTVVLEPLDDKLTENLRVMRRCNGRSSKRRREHFGISRPNRESGRERRREMSKNVEGMMKALEVKDIATPHPEEGKFDVDKSEGEEYHDPMEDENDLPNSLSEYFLGQCEHDMKRLRLMKSETLVANTELSNEANDLAGEMHLSGRDVVSLSIQFARKNAKEFPAWWDPRIAEEVCKVVTTSKSIVGVSKSFTEHLQLVHACLMHIASGRRELSQKLKGVVESAYETLLTAVDGEMYASEAYEAFHASLFRLPALSKEHIQALCDEMNTLVAANEIMAQSEIEALTVVWDAVNITSSQRGHFWSDLEETTASARINGAATFDSVLQSFSDVEDWLRQSAIDAAKIHRQLHIRQFKLQKIHEEVEKQRLKQDARSRIISLDSEVRILRAKLQDFEDKAGSKQRLLTKKMNSAGLLKEEKFRKQMQGKMQGKLEALGKLLREWKNHEGDAFDADILSDDVKALLIRSDNFGDWVEERTAFMHLRTTTNPSGKRRAEDHIDKGLTSDLNSTRNRRLSPHSAATEHTRSHDKTTKKSQRSAGKTKAPPGTSNKRHAPTTKGPVHSKRAHNLRALKVSSPALEKVRAPRTRTPLAGPNKSKDLKVSISSEPAVLPFGQVLAKTPIGKLKENKEPNT